MDEVSKVLTDWGQVQFNGRDENIDAVFIDGGPF